MNDLTGRFDLDVVSPSPWDALVREHMSRVIGHAHRLTQNRLEAEDLAQEVFIRAFTKSVAERLVSIEAPPDEALDARTLDEEMVRALADLSPSHRAAVALCDLEGMSYAGVAAALGKQVDTARSHIHRGRCGLRVDLAHRAPTVRGPAIPEAAADAAA